MDCQNECLSQDCHHCRRMYKDNFFPFSKKIEETLLYQHLNIVEKFMVDSGIRQFCQSICKGDCCRSCARPEGPTRCYNGGPRNIACSSFLCGTLKSILEQNGVQPKNYKLIGLWGNEFYKIYNKKDYARYERNSQVIPKIGNPLRIKKILEKLPVKNLEELKKYEGRFREINTLKRNLENWKDNVAEAEMRLKELETVQLA
jgi:hypothetical protein